MKTQAHPYMSTLSHTGPNCNTADRQKGRSTDTRIYGYGAHTSTGRQLTHSHAEPHNVTDAFSPNSRQRHTHNFFTKAACALTVRTVFRIGETTYKALIDTGKQDRAHVKIVLLDLRTIDDSGIAQVLEQPRTRTSTRAQTLRRRTNTAQAHQHCARAQTLRTRTNNARARAHTRTSAAEEACTYSSRVVSWILKQKEGVMAAPGMLSSVGMSVIDVICTTLSQPAGVGAPGAR